MSKKILIVGSGFMGTSIALALDQKDTCCVEQDHEHQRILKNESIYNEVFSSYESVSGTYDLIIICTRQTDALRSILYFCEHFPESLVTDISSSKNFLVNQELPKNFISSHPICGSHKVGPANAEANLLKDKEVIILSNTINNNVKNLKDFWHSLGANTSEMTFDQHDKYYAYLSHFPHFFSFLYKEILEEEGINYQKYSGDSMKEILRLSEANKDLWNEIFSDNKINLDMLKEKIKKKLL